ncbi:MAG TPA: AbrB/MazE/SpoVT family DNA-binding domain-containing protein [Acidobacteriota bacterium]
MKSVVSEKGQITIPKSLRERLGIKPGQVLDFREEAGALVARKMKDEDPIRSVYGILKTKRRTDQIINALRGPAEK